MGDIDREAEGDERMQQTNWRNEVRGDSTKDLLSEQRRSIFSGEEEVFAFKRATSRIYEMNSERYRKESAHCEDAVSVELLANLQIPSSIPPRSEKCGLSISEQLRVIPRKNKAPKIKDTHISGYADWGTMGSGIARTLREKFFTRRSG